MLGNEFMQTGGYVTPEAWLNLTKLVFRSSLLVYRWTPASLTKPDISLVINLRTYLSPTRPSSGVNLGPAEVNVLSHLLTAEEALLQHLDSISKPRLRRG
jgi:hypothetical protein